MKTRVANWYDTKGNRPMYGFEVHHNGKWKHAHENGVPCIYATEGERDAKMAEAKRLER